MVHFSEFINKYAEWRVLLFLLRNSSPHYIKELAKKVPASPATVSKVVGFLEKAGMADVEKIGNLRRYSLKDDPMIRELKVLSSLLLLDEIKAVDEFLKVDGSIASIILYGSYAEGTYDDKSDVDLLVISEKRADFSKTLGVLEKRVGREVTLLKYKVSELMKAKAKDRVFYENLKTNHKILYGGGLP